MLATLSRELPRDLVFLCVIPTKSTDDEHAAALKIVTRLSDMNIPGTPTVEVVRSDDPAAAILFEATACDLVVLGMRRSRAGRKMLGAINRRVAAEAACAVMVLSRRQQAQISDLTRPIRDVAQIVPFMPRRVDETEH